jgi:hypothetical protein
MRNSKIVALLGLFLIQQVAVWAASPEQEFTRTINREFGTLANGMTAIYNKYGTVNVKTWGSNAVKIDITIIVNAKDQRDADKMFERIKVNFANTSGYVKAETMIASKSGWWVEDNSCQDFKINYEVSMPVNNQLDLKNKYGNAYVATLNGKLTAEIRYGDLRTEAINNDADLNIAYGKAFLTRVNNLYGQLSYSKLSLDQARDVQFDSKYSELNLSVAGAVRLTSKYDDLSFGSLEDLRLQTKYSDVKLQKARAAYFTTQYTDVRITGVGDAIDADMCYGSLKIESLGRNFNDVNIVGKYTDVLIATERGASFRFDAETNYAGLRTPSGATIRRRDDSGAREVVEGYVGDSNAKGVVKARLSYGDFVLR